MSNTDKSGGGYPGQQGINDSATDYNKHARQISQMLAYVRTAVLVTIGAVDVPDDGLAPVGFVDATPLVNQMDGGGNCFPHGTVFNLPYFRIQGGVNAVVLDPKAGDIGVALICDRDISSVKANKGVANPGSRRRFSLADGLYIGGFLNGRPTCRVHIKDEYVSMTPDDGVTAITLTPGLVRIVGATVEVHATGRLKFDADGNGTEIAAASRVDYVIGSTNTTQPLNPPEVP